MTDIISVNEPNEHLPQKALSRRRQALVEALPAYNWNLTRAALSLGYSKIYVAKRLGGELSRDVGFCRAVELKKREISRQTWSVGDWRKMVTEALDRAKAANDRTTERELLRLIGQHIGAFEADNRQRQANFGMLIM